MKKRAAAPVGTDGHNGMKINKSKNDGVCRLKNNFYFIVFQIKA